MQCFKLCGVKLIDEGLVVSDMLLLPPSQCQYVRGFLCQNDVEMEQFRELIQESCSILVASVVRSTG